ncbi:MAG: carbonic anhydrase [Verrucomicrobiae bacterium]|nr:carbonic anhydrase [Verrucomicrobiae bacterium]
MNTPPTVTPKTALHEVFYGNDLFVQVRNPKQFEAYEKSQHPSVTMLTCCDSRLHQLVFNFDPIDRTFVVQNIGNQLQPAAGSIDYGIKHLKTPLLLILGHTRCGAIKAAMSDYRGVSWEIIRELNGLHLPLLGSGGQGDDEKAWLKSVERNVDYQVDLAMLRYHEDVKAGHLAIAGCVYDFANLYGCGRGRILLMNLNGETAPEKLGESDLMKDFDGALRDVVIMKK